MCLSSFLWIRTANNIGPWSPSVLCFDPYLHIVSTVVNGLLRVEAVERLAKAHVILACLIAYLPCLPVKPWKITLVSLFMRRFSAVAAYPEVAVE